MREQGATILAVEHGLSRMLTIQLDGIADGPQPTGTSVLKITSKPIRVWFHAR